MRLFRVSRISVAVVFLLFLPSALKVRSLAAQNEAAATQESVHPLQITANDEIAAGDTESHHIHLHQLRSNAAARARYEDPEVSSGNSHQE
jgi:hypothetical protein